MFKLSTFLILFSISANSFCQKAPKYEMRGLWVATVKNIDWPSKPGLTTEAQQKEAVAILDKAKSMNFNTIFLQIRPTSDAFYASSLEPASSYLTGVSGQKPAPFYDPLAYWIDQAHARGIELHAWINPFRGDMSVNDKLADEHPVHTHPNWFVTYNNRHQYDPGNPQCRDHIANVVAEIVKNYDIDGIHLDDYFYPYPKAGEMFQDDDTFAQFNPKGLSKADWRRQNVDNAILTIRASIKSQKDYVAFGIGPFGVWRNKADDPRGSDTRAGTTNYDVLYADVLLWLQQGWIDYVAPQIYWDTYHPVANYKVLADWWNKNSYGKPVFIGHALYRVNSDAAPWDDPNQILEQIKIARSKANVYGSIFFSATHLNRNLKGLQDSLMSLSYKTMALVPNIIENPNVNTDATPLIVRKWGKQLKWTNRNNTMQVKRYVVYAYENQVSNPENDAANIIGVTNSRSFKIDTKRFSSKTIYFKVSAVDRYNNETALSYPKRVYFK